MRKKISIHDVAKELDLSSATIPSELNGQANALMDVNGPVILFDRYLPSLNIGFDDSTHFYLFTPSITAVAKPIEEIFEEVVKRFPDALSDEKKAGKGEQQPDPLNWLKEIHSPTYESKTNLEKP